jgi:hypothetical protein
VDDDATTDDDDDDGEGGGGGGTPVDDEPALVSFELVLEEDELPSHHSQERFLRLPTFLRKKTRAGAVAAPPSVGPTTIEDKAVEEVEEKEVATPDDKEDEVATPDDDDGGDDQEEEARFKLDDRTRRCAVVGAGDGFELSLDDEVRGSVPSPVGGRVDRSGPE